MKLFSRVFLIFILIGMFAAGTYYFFNSKKVTFSTSKVIRKNLIKTITIDGKISPYRSTKIAAPYNGYIKKIYVKLGQSVKKGSPIVSVTQTLNFAHESVYPIPAPFAGTIVQINNYAGEYVLASNNSNHIVRIDDLNKLFIDADVTELDISKLEKGLKGVVKVSALNDKEYEAVVRELFLAPKDDNSNWGQKDIKYPVRLEILNKDDSLKSGMSVLVDIIVNKKEDVLVLKHEYINKDKDKKYVILEDGTKIFIRTGLFNDEEVEVLDGIREGDIVRQVDFLSLKKRSFK
jgi:cobalt-zinc-cadmium efflux system membrane fusion protein